MPKQRPSRQPWDVRAADVLAGRADLDAGELIDLIHEVNPTGRGKSGAETAARYALKSRLQSLLVVQFAADLEVAPDPGDPKVASLRHRYKRHDACHAVIASLDDEARSWVQRQLDLAASAGPESEEAAESAPASEEAAPGDEDEMSAAELLAAGEEAQASYDYERAGRCFARAVAGSGGGVAAAVAFLSFMVDAMAADDEALAMERRLPAATLADPAVALLLAVAAARAGDEARALRHVARARDPRAAEVLVALARRALAEGDVERAARHHRAAEAEDPAHPELRDVADGIAGLRAAERAPREAALAAHLAAGLDAEALAEAEAILARWPESEPARRAARQIEERLREGAGKRHLAEAEEALARGETAVALERLARALASPLPGPERERALARVREAEALEREHAVKAQVDQVAALLADADRARALAAYVELDDRGRAAVRARVSLPALQWLDAMPAARPGGRVRPSVEAALALARAASLVEKDASGAAALVAPHERLLDEVPLFRSIVERARAAAAADRERRALAELHEAEEALAGAHLERARALLDKLDVRALPEGDKARVAALGAGLAAAEERRREERRFEHLEAAGAFRAARAAALALAERGGSVERERWTAKAAAVEEARARYALKADDLSAGPELLQSPGYAPWTRPVSAWVADGGRELVLCNTESSWMFLRTVDIDTGRVIRGVRLVLDEPMYDVRLSFHAGVVTAVGSSGLFEIDVAGGELVQRFRRNWNRDHGLAFSEGVQPEGTRLLWGSYGTDDEVVKIVDLDGEPAVKTFHEIGGPWPLVGAKPPRVVLKKNWYDREKDGQGYTVQVYDAAGAPLGKVEMKREPDVAVVHPSGAGMLVLSDEYQGEAANRVTLFEVSERFEIVAATVLEERAVNWPQPAAQMVPALDAGLVFVAFVRSGAPHATLIAFRSAGPGVPLVELYRVPVPIRTALAHDQSGRRAFAVVGHPGGLAVVQLGPEPPADLPDSGPAYWLPEPFEHVNWCGLFQSNRAVYVYVDLRKLPAAGRAAAIAAREEEAASDPRKLVELFHAMLSGEWLEDAERILARAVETFPDDPDVRIAPFALLVARRQWTELVAALDAAGPERFGTEYGAHYHHLRATAHARLGDVDEARRHLALLEVYNPCSNRLDHLRKALATLPGGADDLAFDRPASAQLVAVLRAADRSMAEGDPAGAVAVLDRPLTWDLKEIHSLSRLAAAHLALTAATPAERFRKAFALAAFVECVDFDRGGSRREGLAPGLAWTEERIQELFVSADAWLEAEHGVRRTFSWKR